MVYYYPQNLKAKARLAYWNLKQLLCGGSFLMLAVWFYSATGIIFLLVGSVLYFVLSASYDECSVLEFLKRCLRYFFTETQTYVWCSDNQTKTKATMEENICCFSKLKKRVFFFEICDIIGKLRRRKNIPRGTSSEES